VQGVLPPQTETICAGSFSYLHHMPERGAGEGAAEKPPDCARCSAEEEAGWPNLGTEDLFYLIYLF